MRTKTKIKYLTTIVLALTILFLVLISFLFLLKPRASKGKIMSLLVPQKCQELYSNEELKHFREMQFYKLYPEPKLSFWQSLPGEEVKICFPHLFLQAMLRGIPLKIKIYRDGFLVQDKRVSLIEIKKNFIAEDILPDGRQHDYIIQILNLQGKALITSHPKVLVSQHFPKQENQVKVEWLPKPPTFDSNLIDYVLKKGFEKLVYVVRKSPFEGKGEINEVVLVIEEKTMEIKSLKIYGSLPKGEVLGPILVKLENPYVLLKYDANFSSNSFIWDDAIVTWFSLDLDPQIAQNTLDFWYSLQIKNGKHKGLIPREVRTRYYPLLINGGIKLEENINPISFHSLDSNQITGPFILSRVELELFRKTKDKTRLKRVLPFLVSYFEWVEKNRKTIKFVPRIHTNCPYYWTSNLGSGMDNSPRGGGNENSFNFKKYGWLDLAAQQATLAKDISEIATIIEDQKTKDEFGTQYFKLKQAINQCYWDSKENFWFDVKPNGELDKDSQTAAFIWGVYAGLADQQQLEHLVKNWINNSKKFGGYPPLPSLARDHKFFNEDGDYWVGGCWPPIWWLTIKGLEENGAPKTARELALQIFQTMDEVFKKEGSVFEFYAPTPDKQGKAKVGIRKENRLQYKARSEFLGWGKLPLILNTEFRLDK